MDIFAHGLWAAVAAKGANKSQKGPRLRVGATVLWGILPDIFAFTISIAWMVGGLLFGNLTLGEFGTNRPPLAEPLGPHTIFVFSISFVLYQISHSIVVFLFVFFAVWVLYRRPMWELGGWLLHILIDIPTHTYQFFPTPVFWPLFDWKFDGFAWGTPWFIIFNYTALLLLFLLLRNRRQEKK